MAKGIRIIDDNGELIDPKKAVVFLFDDDENTETSNVTMEMVGMSGRDLYMIVSAAVCLGKKLGMFGEVDEDA